MILFISLYVDMCHFKCCTKFAQLWLMLNVNNQLEFDYILKLKLKATIYTMLTQLILKWALTSWICSWYKRYPMTPSIATIMSSTSFEFGPYLCPVSSGSLKYNIPRWAGASWKVDIYCMYVWMYVWMSKWKNLFMDIHTVYVIVCFRNRTYKVYRVLYCAHYRNCNKN